MFKDRKPDDICDPPQEIFRCFTGTLDIVTYEWADVGKVQVIFIEVLRKNFPDILQNSNSRFALIGSGESAGSVFHGRRNFKVV
jgi:hypothetical protein